MKLLKKLFYEPYWECYYRKVINGPEIFDLNNNNEGWTRVRIPRRYWCADPFLFNYEDSEYLFCEVMDRKKSYGMLGCAKIENGSSAQVKVIKDIGCHTSYPNIFRWKDDIYMIPESVERHTIELYICTCFPDKWEKVALLATDLDAVDTTVFIQDGNVKLFIYEQLNNHKNYTLSIAELDMNTLKLGPIYRLVEYDKKLGRPAGNVISINNCLFRPTQFGEKFYGEKIILQRLSYKFDGSKYRYHEEKELEISVENYSKELGKRFIGTHTYNYDNGYEVVDCFRKRFYFERPIMLLLKMCKLGGYSFHEEK